MILDPSGEAIGEALSEDEGIVYAEIDTSRSWNLSSSMT
jgi:hypothetical protein